MKKVVFISLKILIESKASCESCSLHKFLVLDLGPTGINNPIDKIEEVFFFLRLPLKHIAKH